MTPGAPVKDAQSLKCRLEDLFLETQAASRLGGFAGRAPKFLGRQSTHYTRSWHAMTPSCDSAIRVSLYVDIDPRFLLQRQRANVGGDGIVSLSVRFKDH